MKPHLKLFCCLILLALPLPGQLSGTFAIVQTLPTGGGVFGSLADAVTALMTQGVSGPVTFEVFDDGGPFTETNVFFTNNVTWAPGTAVLVLGQWVGASPQNRVTFRAAPGEHPVFDAQGQAMGVFWNGADFVTLQGIEIKNATFDAISLYSESQHGNVQDAWILRCLLHDCGGTGVTIYGNSQTPENTLIENCWLWNLQTTNAGGFSTLARFGYISGRRQFNTKVRNCTFFMNTGVGSLLCIAGITPATGNSSSGTSQPDTPFAEFTNNIIHKSVTGGVIHRWPEFQSTPMYPATSDANCYWDASAGIFATYGTGSGVTNSDPDLATWQTNTGRDASSFAADPLLVNGPGGDLHIRAGSPCRDASLLASPATLDIDGNARPQGQGPDIGADENESPLPVPPVTSFSTGSGCVGSNGLVPVLVSPGLPALGNTLFHLTAQNIPSGMDAHLFLAFALAPQALQLAPGCRFFLDLQSTLTAIQLGLSPLGPVTADANGQALFYLPIPENAALAGLQLKAQALVLDTAIPLGLSLSNALEMQID